MQTFVDRTRNRFKIKDILPLLVAFNESQILKVCMADPENVQARNCIRKISSSNSARIPPNFYNRLITILNSEICLFDCDSFTTESATLKINYKPFLSKIPVTTRHMKTLSRQIADDISSKSQSSYSLYTKFRGVNSIYSDSNSMGIVFDANIITAIVNAELQLNRYLIDSANHCEMKSSGFIKSKNEILPYSGSHQLQQSRHADLVLPTIQDVNYIVDDDVFPSSSVEKKGVKTKKIKSTSYNEDEDRYYGGTDEC